MRSIDPTAGLDVYKRQIVSLLTAYLTETLGVPHENIAILVALGTHRPMTEEELKTLVTPEVYARFAVFNHDCLADDLVFVGTTARGTEVRVNPLCVGRKVIVISGTVHHLMSGFGGGRKSILPGVSAKRTIVQNHLHCLHETEPRSADTIGMAKLTGNPVHEDMAEAASFVAPVFGISIVSNAEGQHCALCCGDFAAAWGQSCRLVHQNFGLPISRLADVVGVSCGGFPKDLNLYQAVKSLLNAAQALKPGGTMVFLAQCPEGGGAPDFFDWIHALDRGTLDRDLRAAFTIAGYIFYASVEAIDRCPVSYTHLDVYKRQWQIRWGPWPWCGSSLPSAPRAPIRRQTHPPRAAHPPACRVGPSSWSPGTAPFYGRGCPRRALHTKCRFHPRR